MTEPDSILDITNPRPIENERIELILTDIQRKVNMWEELAISKPSTDILGKSHGVNILQAKTIQLPSSNLKGSTVEPAFLFQYANQPDSDLLKQLDGRPYVIVKKIDRTGLNGAKVVGFNITYSPSGLPRPFEIEKEIEIYTLGHLTTDSHPTKPVCKYSKFKMTVDESEKFGYKLQRLENDDHLMPMDKRNQGIIENINEILGEVY